MGKYLFSLLIFAYLANGDISFKLDSSCGESVPGNLQVEMMVTAEWPQGEETYVIFKPTLPGISGLSISEEISFGETLTLNSQIIQRVIHLYKFSITNAPGEIAETGNVFVDYRNAAEEEIQHKQLSGFSFKVTSPEHNFFVIIVFGIIGILVLIVIFVIKRKKKVTKENLAPVIEIGFLEKLNSIKRLRLEGNIPFYFQELEILLRDYFRKKYNIGSLEDWVPSSNSSVGPDNRTLSVIIDLLKLSRDVRYAGTIPNTHDQERIFDFLKKIFTKNLPRQSLKEELYLRK